MRVAQLQKFFAATVEDSTAWQRYGWLALSLAFAALYGYLSLRQGFSNEYVVQDDARQQVFWMQRFLDPTLFPNDWIADYFQSVSPAGVTVLYRLAAAVGLDPWTFNRFVPFGLGLLSAGYCYVLCLQLLPVPSAGFIASLLLSQNLWMQDTLISGTAKAFLHPFFLAFLVYLLRRSLWPCLGAIALLGTFYPAGALLAVAVLVLRLVKWSWPLKWRYLFVRDRAPYVFCGAGLVVAFAVLLPYAVGTSEFGPTVTLQMARTMPEFGPSGRARFFIDNGWDFWFNASRSGIRFAVALMPPLVYTGFLLSLLRLVRRWFPLARHVTAEVVLLPQLVVASLGWFAIAHLRLFQFHLPSRYTQHSLRIVMVLAAAIALTLLVDGLLRWGARLQSAFWVRVVALAGTAAIAFNLIFYPAKLDSFLWTGYSTGEVPQLYQFIAQQPKETLIASLAEEANNLPSFSQRSILVGREYAIPYHVGYYREIRQRTIDLIQAQYSPDLLALQDFIQTYQVDLWLLDRHALTIDYLEHNDWLHQYPEATSTAQRQLAQGKTPAINAFVDRCRVFNTDRLVLLDADCIAAAPTDN